MADVLNIDGTTIGGMKTTYLWSVVNPLAPGLVDCMCVAAPGYHTPV